MSSPALPLPPGARLVSGPSVPTSPSMALPPGAKLVSGSPPASASGDKGFFSGLLNTINPIPAIENFVIGRNPDTGKIGGPIQGAENFVSDAFEAGKQQFLKARAAAFGEGEFQGMTPLERASETFGHGASALIPFAGPAAANAGDKIGNGQTGEGLGEAAGLVGSVLAPSVLAKGSPAAVGAIAPAAEDALRSSAEQN
jgi:hypothetical protein